MPRRRRFKLPTTNDAAARDYLTRELESYDWLKQAPRADLLAHARSTGYRFASDPWDPQLVCFTIASQLPDFLFFLKMGGGKSKIFLDQVRYRRLKGHLHRALVVVPEELHVNSWEEQIREHAPDLKYWLLLGERSERMDLIERKSDLCVVNWAGLRVYMTKREQHKKKNKKTEVIDPRAAGEFCARFNMLAVDEIHRMTTRESIWFEMVRWLSCSCDFRYAFSGSSFGRDPLPLWLQFFLIDQGKTLGPTMGPFRNAFYTPKKHYWAGMQWEFNRTVANVLALHRIIKNRSIVYEAKELRAHMPPRVTIRTPVRLRGDGLAYYQRILLKVREARGDYRSLDNMFTRMRQCASGFIAMKADDASRIEVQFRENPKLEALQQLVLSKPDDKFLVFHEFVPSGRMIEKMLAAQRVGYASVRGEIADQGAQYQRFLRDPKCRVFVLNNQLGSEAINPQYVCRRAVFYESPTDPKRREQAEMRVDRPGQDWTTWIYDLVAKGTVEEKLLKYHKEGKDLQRAVMAGDVSGLETEDLEE